MLNKFAFILLILITCICHMLTAQTKVFVVRGAVTKEAMPNAAILFTPCNLTTHCNASGIALVNTNKIKTCDSLKVSYLGYSTFKGLLTDLLEKDTVTIFLNENSYSLHPLEIKANAAALVILKAIEKIKDNYISSAYLQKAFYRQAHIENEKYVRLIESDVTTLNTGILKGESFNHRLMINGLRRSTNYEKNGEEHGDHIYDLLRENSVWYPDHSILKEAAIDYYDCEIENTTDSLISISFRSKQLNQDFLEKGLLKINTNDQAIVYYKCEKYKNKECTIKRNYYNPGLNWLLQNSEKEITYQKSSTGKYALQTISFSYNHNLFDADKHKITYTVKEQFGYFPYLTEPAIGYDVINYQKSGNLYLFEYKNLIFDWNNYRALQKHPLPEKAITDLSALKPLELQFRENAKR